MSKRKPTEEVDKNNTANTAGREEKKDRTDDQDSEFLFISKKRKIVASVDDESIRESNSTNESKESNESKKISPWIKMPSQLLAKISSFNHSCYNHAKFARVSRQFRDVARKPTSWPNILTMRVLDFRGDELEGPKIIIFKHDRPIFLSDQTANSISKYFTDYRPTDLILTSQLSFVYSQEILDRLSKCFDKMKFGGLQSVSFSFILIELPGFVRQISAGQCAKYKKLLYELQGNVTATDNQTKFVYDITAPTLTELTTTGSMALNLYSLKPSEYFETVDDMITSPDIMVINSGPTPSMMRNPNFIHSHYHFKPRQLPNLKNLNMSYSNYDGIDDGTGLFTTKQSTQIKQVILEDCSLDTDTLLDASKNLNHVSIKITNQFPTIQEKYVQMMGKCQTKKLTFDIIFPSTMEFNETFARSLGKNQFIQDLHMHIRGVRGNLEHLGRMTNLQSLNLEFTQSIVQMTNIAFPSSLTTLSCKVQGSRYISPHIPNSPIMMAIGNCLRLEKLLLKNINLPDDESTHPADLTIFANLTHLREMEIDSLKLNKQFNIEVDEFVISPSLTTLSIVGKNSLIFLSSAISSRCKLTNLSVKYIPFLKLVGVLTLDPNPLVAPTDVATFPPLETLTLYYETITEMKEWTGLLGGHRDGILRRFAECYPQLKTVHIIYSHSFGGGRERTELQIAYILNFFPTNIKELFISDDSIRRDLDWNHLEWISESLLTSRWSKLTEFMWTIPCSDYLKSMLESLGISSWDNSSWETVWKYIDDDAPSDEILIPSQEVGLPYMSFRQKLQKAIPSLSKIHLVYRI